MKANFRQRLLAHFIDVLILSFIVSIISVGFGNEKVIKLNDKANELMNSYLSGDVDEDDYINDYIDIYYDISRAGVINNVVYLVVSVGYFLIFQYLNGGASIGKKLMKIRIVNRDKGDVSFLQMFVRTAIVNEILPMLIIILLIFVTNGFTFFVGYSIISLACNLFVITCIVMILYRKDMLALHDIMSRSMVIREDI